MSDNLRRRALKRLGILQKEQSSWRSHWQELNDYVMPRRLRYLNSDVNKGTKRNDKIINITPIKAARTLSSGMMAGLTSPARPWFHLIPSDPKLASRNTVRMWLYEVERRIREVFNRSNLYNCLPLVYTDLGVFGTSCMLVEEDDEDIVRGYVLPVGQYYLANSARMAVDTVYREFQLTVSQLVERFGLDACSQRVKDAFGRGDYDTWIEVVHVIEPNPAVTYGSPGPNGMPFRSLWFEKAGDTNTGFLRVSGFAEFPAMAPRWNVTGEDVYGYSPAMDALGDARALQLYERRKAQAADKIVNPPMVGPSSLKNQTASLLPGTLTTVDVVTGGQTFKPAIDVKDSAVATFDSIIREHEARIQQSFYADLWLMLANSDRREITAREIDERHEEKMLQLGPVVDRLHDELLDPLLDRVFSIMMRRGDLPPPPQELQGQRVRVEYVSIMAQAQKLLFTTGIERLAGFAGNLMQAAPEVLRRINFDRAVVEYAELLNVPPTIIKSDEEVAAAAAEAEQAKQQEQMAQAAPAMQQGAQAAQLLSETDVNKDSAFSRLMGALGGGAPPAPIIPPGSMP